MMIMEVQWIVKAFKKKGRWRCVEIEINYNQQEIILIGVYSAYLSLLERQLQHSQERYRNSWRSYICQDIEKGKADVVEAEFHT
jgi:hypothetical protein